MSMSPQQAACPGSGPAPVNAMLDPSAALPLMGVFAAVGWAVGTIVSVLPGLSASTRAHAAAVRDHALVAAFLAGVASAIGSAADWVLRTVLAGGAGAAVSSHWAAIDFFIQSAVLAGFIIGVIGAASAVASVIPVLGPALAFMAGVVYGPSTLILTTIIIMSVFQSATLLVTLNSLPLIYPAGFALMAAPGKVAKGLGAFLISLSLVMYVAAPIIPYAIASVASVTRGLQVDPGILSQALSRICSLAQGLGAEDVSAVLLRTPPDYYAELYTWLVMVVAGAIIVALALAAARALSHSIGGVSASI